MSEDAAACAPGLVLSDDEAATLTRVLNGILKLKEPEDAAGQAALPNSQEFRCFAQNVLTARRKRNAFLSPSLMGEPAWDMLLAMYLNQDGMQVTDAVEQSGAAPTTALRWLEHLKDHGLIDKTRNEADRRIWLVSISREGREALESYFASLPESLLGKG